MRDTVDAARYEAPNEMSRQELLDFLAEYSEFLESDGRHHLWVANPEEGTIVYDRGVVDSTDATPTGDQWLYPPSGG